MNEIEAEQKFIKLFDSLGVQKGDCLMIGIDMAKVPLPNYKADFNKEAFREREKRWCKFVFNCIYKRIGSDGTLLVPTYSYSCSNSLVFSVEDSSSEVGGFTEYVRTLPTSVRSKHPLFSIAGTGKLADTILKFRCKSSFGVLSPFGQFSKYQVKFLCLGVPLKECLTYVHHLEQIVGCPHRYNKVLNISVYENNKLLSNEWYSYLNFFEFKYKSDISSLQYALSEDSSLRAVTWNDAEFHLAEIEDVDRLGYKLLSRNYSSFVDTNLKINFNESPAEMFDNFLSGNLNISLKKKSKRIS